MSKKTGSAGIAKTEGTLWVSKLHEETDYRVSFDQPKLRYTYAIHVTETELLGFAKSITKMIEENKNGRI